MPVGILTNVASVFAGGVIGGVIGNKLPKNIVESLTAIFGFATLLMGTVLMVGAVNLSAIVLALIVGMLIGELLHLDKLVNKTVLKMQKTVKVQNKNEDFMNQFVAVMVMFCTGGMGIFGAMNEGLTHDGSILIAKSILDFFSSIIFGTSLGAFVSLISLPQAVIYLSLFLGAGYLMPFINDVMIADFKAIGGLVAVIAGFNLLKIKQIRIVNVLPALILIFPFSYIWERFM